MQLPYENADEPLTWREVKARVKAFLVVGFICFPTAVGAIMFPAMLGQAAFAGAPAWIPEWAIWLALAAGMIWFGVYALCMAVTPFAFLIAGTYGGQELIRRFTLPLIKHLTRTFD